jgi:hypothetical protein
MAIRFNTALQNEVLDGLDATFNNGTLEIRTGTPAGPNNAATGTVLATVTLPADAFAAAAGGTKAKAGTWTDNAADNTGTAGHFRLRSADGLRIMEGTVTIGGGGGDMTVDNTSFAAGQQFTITGFTMSSTNT